MLSRVVSASQEAERIALGVQPLIFVSASTSTSEQPPAAAADSDLQAPDLVFSKGMVSWELISQLVCVWIAVLIGSRLFRSTRHSSREYSTRTYRYVRIISRILY